MTRRKIVAGNWKMHLNKQEAQQLASEVVALSAEVPAGVELILCTPSVHLDTVRGVLGKGDKVALGAQNCSQHVQGAYTGEISAGMVKSYGAGYVILGHSERRQYFKETDAELAKKVDRVLENGLEVIFCCGETLEERESGRLEAVVATQLKDGLFHLGADQLQDIVIAYEPVWAIGTGKTATSAQAQEMHAFIRGLVAKQYGNDAAKSMPILYGGSCKASNAQELFACPDVDGGLIGGASLKAREFVDIAKSF